MERNQSPYVYEPNAEGVRNFHIGDILSITTGRLVSPRRMDGVYDILNYMTGDDLFTHQLIRAAEECAPALREQHPDLTDVDAGGVPWRGTRPKMARRFGDATR